MPRPSPPNPSAVFSLMPQPLSDADRLKLAELLGYPDYDFLQESIDCQLGGGRVLACNPGAPLAIERPVRRSKLSRSPRLGMAVLETEAALALCVGGKEHLDNLPRGVHYRQVAARIKREALTLLNGLCELSEHYLDALTLSGANIEDTQRELAKLFDAAFAVEKLYATQKESRGRAKEVALREGVQRLRAIFRNYSAPLSKHRSAKGSFASRSPYEAAELEFLRFFLVRSGALSKERAKSTLERVLREPAFTPPPKDPKKGAT